MSADHSTSLPYTFKTGDVVRFNNHDGPYHRQKAVFLGYGPIAAKDEGWISIVGDGSSMPRCDIVKLSSIEPIETKQSRATDTTGLQDDVRHAASLLGVLDVLTTEGHEYLTCPGTRVHIGQLRESLSSLVSRTEQSKSEEYGYKIDPDAFARLYMDNRRSLGVPIPVRNEWIKSRSRCPSDEELAAFDDGYLAAVESFHIKPTVQAQSGDEPTSEQIDAAIKALREGMVPRLSEGVVTIPVDSVRQALIAARVRPQQSLNDVARTVDSPPCRGANPGFQDSGGSEGATTAAQTVQASLPDDFNDARFQSNLATLMQQIEESIRVGSPMWAFSAQITIRRLLSALERQSQDDEIKFVVVPPHLREDDAPCQVCGVGWKDHQAEGVFHHPFEPEKIPTRRATVQAKAPVEITDEMVERAERAYFGLPPASISEPRDWMRKALEAALNG